MGAPQRGRSGLSVRMGCQRVSINLNRGMKSRRGMSIKVKRGEKSLACARTTTLKWQDVTPRFNVETRRKIPASAGR